MIKRVLEVGLPTYDWITFVEVNSKVFPVDSRRVM
jgi:hypothetical protein